MAEHCCFGFDAADAPTENADAVDHGGVGVGADDRVRIGVSVAFNVAHPNALAEIFEVHLVADAGAGWDDAEILERALAPAQELIALSIALVFEFDVHREGAGAGEVIDHH